MHLEVIVEDEGVGFEPGDYLRGSEDYTHFGLRNITSRIRAIGGKNHDRFNARARDRNSLFNPLPLAKRG